MPQRYESNGWQDQVAELQVGRENLEEGVVLIPWLKVTDFSKVKVLGMSLKDGPDPRCLGIKGGMGFVTQITGGRCRVAENIPVARIPSWREGIAIQESGVILPFAKMSLPRRSYHGKLLVSIQ